MGSWDSLWPAKTRLKKHGNLALRLAGEKQTHRHCGSFGGSVVLFSDKRSVYPFNSCVFCYSYGWVKNQFVVIPRIISNPKCGKSGVGVVIWRSSLSSRHRAYCHNSSGELDLWSLHVVCVVWISIAL